MKLKTIILIGIAVIICSLVVYYLGDLWMADMTPGKESSSVADTAVSTIIHKI